MDTGFTLSFLKMKPTVDGLNLMNQDNPFLRFILARHLFAYLQTGL